jgi:hypothetical protein
MGYRAFTHSQGTQWQTWDVIPTLAAVSSARKRGLVRTFSLRLAAMPAAAARGILPTREGRCAGAEPRSAARKGTLLPLTAPARNHRAA